MAPKTPQKTTRMMPERNSSAQDMNAHVEDECISSTLDTVPAPFNSQAPDDEPPSLAAGRSARRLRTAAKARPLSSADPQLASIPQTISDAELTQILESEMAKNAEQPSRPEAKPAMDEDETHVGPDTVEEPEMTAKIVDVALNEEQMQALRTHGAVAKVPWDKILRFYADLEVSRGDHYIDDLVMIDPFGRPWHTRDFIVWLHFLNLVQENVNKGFAWSISDGGSGGVYIPATNLLQPLSVEEKAMVVAELCFVFKFFVGVDLVRHGGDEAGVMRVFYAYFEDSYWRKDNLGALREWVIQQQRDLMAQGVAISPMLR